MLKMSVTVLLANHYRSLTHWTNSLLALPFSLTSRNIPVRTLTLRADFWMLFHALSRHPNVRASGALKNFYCDCGHYVQICTLRYITLWYVVGGWPKS